MPNELDKVFTTEWGVMPYKIYGEQDTARGLRWILFARRVPLHDGHNWIGRYYLPL